MAMATTEAMHVHGQGGTDGSTEEPPLRRERPAAADTAVFEGEAWSGSTAKEVDSWHQQEACLKQI